MSTAPAKPASQEAPAAKSGTFKIGGDLSIYRLGYGAMRITGQGIWGEPKDRPETIKVLRRSDALGINFIDTADSYGPHVSEEIIAEALYPYPPGLVIATKAGFDRTGPNQWVMNGNPEHLREACESSLKRLRLERIDLFQLHRIDPKFPAEDQLGTLEDLQQRENIGFIPWFPLAAGDVSAAGSELFRIATQLKTTPSQLALAWLLWRSPVMLPIPGTSRVSHLEENVAAAALKFDESTMRELDKLGVKS